jgi:hypothetical protein
MNTMAKIRPIGVTVVAVLTLLASFILGILSFIVWFVNFVSFAFASSGETVPLTTRNLYALFPPIFALFGFFASIVMLLGISFRNLWYGLITFWIGLLAYFSWWGYTFVWRGFAELLSSNTQVYAYQYEAMIISFFPFAYSLSCLLYFRRAKVKEYFHLK